MKIDGGMKISSSAESKSKEKAAFHDKPLCETLLDLQLTEQEKKLLCESLDGIFWHTADSTFADLQVYG